MRKLEAANALNTIRYGEKVAKAVFLDLPFYKTKDRVISQPDIDILEREFTLIQPDMMFVCSDVDPRGTHLKCGNLAINVANKYNYCSIYRYIGAWDPIFSWRPTHKLKVDDNMKAIINKAWDCYVSQVNLLVNTSDTRSLKSRYEDVTIDGEYLQLIDP